MKSPVELEVLEKTNLQSISFDHVVYKDKGNTVTCVSNGFYNCQINCVAGVEHLLQYSNEFVKEYFDTKITGNSYIDKNSYLIDIHRSYIDRIREIFEGRIRMEAPYESTNKSNRYFVLIDNIEYDPVEYTDGYVDAEYEDPDFNETDYYDDYDYEF